MLAYATKIPSAVTDLGDPRDSPLVHFLPSLQDRCKAKYFTLFIILRKTILRTKINIANLCFFTQLSNLHSLHSVDYACVVHQKHHRLDESVGFFSLMQVCLQFASSLLASSRLLKAVFHWAEFCARSDIFRAIGKVELLSTLLLHNFGGK